MAAYVENIPFPDYSNPGERQETSGNLAGEQLQRQSHLVVDKRQFQRSIKTQPVQNGKRFATSGEKGNRLAN